MVGKFDLQNSEWRGRFGILIATNTKGREGNVGYNSSLHPHLTSVTHYPWTFLVHILPRRFSVKKKHAPVANTAPSAISRPYGSNADWSVVIQVTFSRLPNGGHSTPKEVKKTTWSLGRTGHSIFHVLANIHEAFDQKNVRPAFATSLCRKKNPTEKNKMFLNLWTNRRCTCFLRTPSFCETSTNVAHKEHVLQMSFPKLRTLNSQIWFFPWTSRNGLHLTANRVLNFYQNAVDGSGMLRIPANQLRLVTMSSHYVTGGF